MNFVQKLHQIMVFLTNSRCFKYQTTYLYVQKAITSKDIVVMVVFRPENSSLRSRQLFPRSRWSRSRNRSRQIIFWSRSRQIFSRLRNPGLEDLEKLRVFMQKK